MNECVFCDIAAEESPRQRHEPWWPMVVIDPIGPHAPWHKLVIPPTHLQDATDDLYQSPLVFQAAVKVGKLMRKPFNIITSVGAEATQSVFHLHVHVIPRGPEDGLPKRWPWLPTDEDRTLASVPAPTDEAGRSNRTGPELEVQADAPTRDEAAAGLDPELFDSDGRLRSGAGIVIASRYQADRESRGASAGRQPRYRIEVSDDGVAVACVVDDETNRAVLSVHNGTPVLSLRHARMLAYVLNAEASR